MHYSWNREFMNLVLSYKHIIMYPVKYQEFNTTWYIKVLDIYVHLCVLWCTWVTLSMCFSHIWQVFDASYTKVPLETSNSLLKCVETNGTYFIRDNEVFIALNFIATSQQNESLNLLFNPFKWGNDKWQQYKKIQMFQVLFSFMDFFSFRRFVTNICTFTS